MRTSHPAAMKGIVRSLSSKLFYHHPNPCQRSREGASVGQAVSPAKSFPILKWQAKPPAPPPILAENFGLVFGASVLETLISLEDFHGIVAAGEIDAGLVFEPFDALAFFKHGQDEVLGDRDDAVFLAEDEVAGVDFHGLGGFSGDAHGRLAFEHGVAPEGLDGAAVAGKDGKTHSDEV